jgi:hypothetical protein
MCGTMFTIDQFLKYHYWILLPQGHRGSKRIYYLLKNVA